MHIRVIKPHRRRDILRQTHTHTHTPVYCMILQAVIHGTVCCYGSMFRAQGNLIIYNCDFDIETRQVAGFVVLHAESFDWNKTDKTHTN
jgi:hypothetical protein